MTTVCTVAMIDPHRQAAAMVAPPRIMQTLPRLTDAAGTPLVRDESEYTRLTGNGSQASAQGNGDGTPYPPRPSKTSIPGRGLAEKSAKTELSF